MSGTSAPANWNDRYDWLYKEMELHLARQDAARHLNYRRATWTLFTATAFIALSGLANKPQLQGIISKVIAGKFEEITQEILVIGLLLLLSYAILFITVIRVYIPRSNPYPFSLIGDDDRMGKAASMDDDPDRSAAYNRARWDEAIKQYFIAEDQFRAKILMEYIYADTEHEVQNSRMTKLLFRAFIAMGFVALFSLLLFLV